MVKAALPQISVGLLSLNPAVQSVELDSVSQIQLDNTSNIAGVVSAEYNTNWGIAHIGVQSAHQAKITGKGIKIAELDTGIDYNHPDLAKAYRGGYDFVNNGPNPIDDNGHGTHVAGIIASAGQHAGEVGVAPDAQLYAVKVADSEGKGTFGLLVQGIDWAIENHMNVVTMSITGEGGSPALEKAVEEAHDKYGITLVAAVGNGNGGGVLFPAAYSDVIGVGAVNPKDQLTSFSLIGPQVELVAPGSMINSTWPGHQYKVLSGTSMATPFVTGTVALILSSDERAWAATKLTNGDGNWTTDEVRRVLDNMTIHLGTAGKNDQYGYGELRIKFPAQNTTSTQQANTQVSSSNIPHLTTSLSLNPPLLLKGVTTRSLCSPLVGLLTGIWMPY
jgi:subtilisin family serine protease